VKEFNVSVDNYTFHGFELGDNGSPSLVCFHGMTGDSNSFLGLIEYLKEDFHLILLDLPGHGETDALKSEEDYRFSSLVKRIYQVIQKLINRSFYILGHSWGADLALNCAKIYRDKIKGLILIDGGYAFPEEINGLTKDKALSDWEKYIVSSKYSSWDGVIKTYQEYTTKSWDNKLDAIISSNFKKVDNNYVLTADRLSLLSTIKAFYLEPCSTTYKLIKCPVILFHSTIPETDLSRNRGIKKISETIENVKVLGIKNTKHNVHWDDPKTVAEEILVWRNEI
jgi:pimeloyl-ACP methyl ester carboxylesterase